ncbi:hypothetical protein QBC39DRAFT_97673 [Podospora conica]|nr:hypothetical protein QBC39DRAFT_97673 [Schizothecium conicum]
MGRALDEKQPRLELSPMDQRPSNAAGNTPSQPTGPGLPRSRQPRAGRRTYAHADPEHEAPPPLPPVPSGERRPMQPDESRRAPRNSRGGAGRNGMARRANVFHTAQSASMAQNRVHRRGSSQSQVQRPQQRTTPRPNPPNRPTAVAGPSRPLLPENSTPPIRSMPNSPPWAAWPFPQPGLTWIMTDHERALAVESYSLATEELVHLCAVINDQIELSIVHPWVVRRLGLAPATLPPGLFGQHRLSPMGRFTPRRYVVLAIGGLRPGIHYEPLHLLVYDDNVTYHGVDIFFGWQALNRYFGGQLPRHIRPHFFALGG